jgi:hypothetical protein
MNFRKMLTGLGASVALVLGTMTVGAGSASAAEVPADQKIWVTETSANIKTGYWGFNVKLGPTAPTAGTVGTLHVYDCHGVRLSETDPNDAVKYFPMPTSPHTFSGQSADNLVTLTWQHEVKLQPLTYELVINIPGYDAYTEQGSFNPNGYSCPPTESQPPVMKSAVKAWGAKHGVAKVRRTVWVSKPSVVSGARVTYTWKVNGHTVSHKSKLWLKKRWKGKRVVAVVKVSKPGLKSGQKTYDFGKVRRR